MISISEIFGPTIQGEGLNIGQQTMFVRVGGCDYRCSWCDTMYAVDPIHKANWTPMSAAAILSKVTELGQGIGSKNITLSGGNPCLYDFEEFLQGAHEFGWKVHVETQGSLAPRWLMHCDSVTISPKPPSSGNETPYEKVEACLRVSKNPILKFVVDRDNDDLAYATGMAHDFGRAHPIVFQPCNRVPGRNAVSTIQATLSDAAWLADFVTSEGLPNVRVLPQWHVLLWGNTRAK